MRLATILLVTAIATVAVSGSALAAKKGNKAATVDASNVTIATPTAAGTNARTSVPLRIGKKFKKKVAGTVEVTLQVTGSAPGYLEDLGIRLVSPQGRAVDLAPPVTDFAPDQSFGPLKLTPDSPVFTCFSPQDCTVPQRLAPPFAGTAGNLELADLAGARIRGTWVVRLIDFEVADTGVLNQVSLRVKPAKPIEVPG